MPENPCVPEIRKLTDLCDMVSDKAAIKACLTQKPRRIPYCLEYSGTGSEAFAQLCHQPEYYPAHVERSLLKREAHRIVDHVQPSQIMDLGCGNMEKTHILIHEAIKKRSTLDLIPCDIDSHIIYKAVERLKYFYAEELTIYPLQGDFQDCIRWRDPTNGPCLYTFLGLTFANMTRHERETFLHCLKQNMSDHDYLLLGVDLIKDHRMIERAYQDNGGFVAAGLRQSLINLNEIYGATFDPNVFEHCAEFDHERRAIVESLVARAEQTVKIPALGTTITVAEGEKIEAEFSEKFVLEELLAELGQRGFCASHTYMDVSMRYALLLLCRDQRENICAIPAAA